MKIKKKNKKGFTLVELLATIVILGIIITIAVISFVNIRARVNENQYQSLASTIKTAGKGYAEETGINKIFVQTLIDEGLVTIDDESKILKDPRDNSPLNCQIVTYDDGKVSLSDDKNPSCDITILNDIAIKIQYINDAGVKEDIPKNYWFNKTITLSVTATGALPVDLSRASFTWSSPLAPDKVSTTRDYTVVGDYVDDTILVTVTIDDRKYQAYTDIKIDKTPPRAFNLIEKNPGNWTPNKEFQFELSDGESGISGWQITYDSYTVPTSWNNLSDAGVKSKVINTTKNLSGLREGEYIYVWVKDLVGNTNKSELTRDGASSLQIKSLDGEIDSVTLTSSPGAGTYSKNITLSGTAQDSKSGITGYFCSKSASAPRSGWISVTKTNAQVPITCPANVVDGNGRYYLHVRDDVGNTKSTYVDINNYDNIVNSVTLADAESYLTYREDSTKLTGTATDEGSGIVAYALTTSQATPYSWTNVPTTRYLNIPLPIQNDGTYYFHVKDALGNTAVSNGVTISGIVVRKSKSYTLTSKTDDYIYEQYYLPGAVHIIDVYTDTGIAQATLNTYGYSYNTYVTVDKGDTYQQYVRKTCTRNASSFDATRNEECTSYSCPLGGKSNGSGMCVALEDPVRTYKYFSNPTTKQKYKCTNGSWNMIEGEYPETKVREHYHYNYDAGNCTSITATCNKDNEGATTTINYGCWATATWDGNYKADCTNKKITYSCPSSSYYGGTTYYLSYSTCYSCSSGESYNSYTHICSKDCSYNQDYWKYNITIYYYVLKSNSYYGY